MSMSFVKRKGGVQSGAEGFYAKPKYSLPAVIAV
jgi:hypothetical protein